MNNLLQLSSKRRRSVLIPIMHDTTQTKNQKLRQTFYQKQYQDISDYIFKTKVQFLIEILFIYPRDQIAFEIISKKHSKDNNLKDKIQLHVLDDSLKKPNHFLAFLPKIVCIPITKEKLNVFDVDCDFTLIFKQLCQLKKWDFDVHPNVRTLVQLIDGIDDTSKLCEEAVKVIGPKIESTYWCIMYTDTAYLLKKLLTFASKKLQD